MVNLVGIVMLFNNGVFVNLVVNMNILVNGGVL